MSEVRTVLGVDLASSNWSNTGTALLTFTTGEAAEWQDVRYGVVPWPSTPVSVGATARTIDNFAREHGVHAVSIDGPQGWREPDASGRRGVGRACELEARTQGKTGIFGVTYPRNQVGWIRFSIDVFAELLNTGHADLANSVGHRRLPPNRPDRYWLLECFPTKTWRSSKLTPLPGKASTRAGDVALWHSALWKRYGFPVSDLWKGSHDDLQAVVAALPAAALIGGPCHAIALGKPAWKVQGSDETPAHQVEGLIWDAAPLPERLAIEVQQPTKGDPKTFTPSDPANPVLIDDRVDDSKSFDRGVRLFDYLATRANSMDPTGIGYASFACFIHGAKSFRELVGRQYLPSDSGYVVDLALQVTAAAGGRKRLARESCVIDAGMDTFIWGSRFPHDRPQPAFTATPYTQTEWRGIFPDGRRRLIGESELAMLSAD